ncbi:MAG TPA: dihydrodipicolinate synthase family protein [Chloroflexota bacterium]|jgi:4-hydroxy-tetrahydrodipicolinate synthase|nr:dihydrodipicolinate synthase family protein [Chloroflexota bacterium]
MDVAQYRGIIPPILTPVQPDGQVDLLSLTRLTNWLIREGVHGIWACGTTGEFPCFDADERENVVGTCAEAAMGRVPLVANISDCSTRLAIEHGLRALRAGADAVALTPPYYYSNTQEELLTHYRVVRDAVDAPLFVYNIPSTVKVKVEVESIVTLAAEGTVVGIKDSQNDLDFARTLSMAANERGVPLRLFLGTRSLIDAALLVGAHGCIPGIANVVPRACLDAYEAAARGDFPVALRAQQRVVDALAITRVVRGSAQAAGMGGMKAALKAMGVIASSNVALPLASPTEEDEARITGIARNLGLHFLTPA